MMKLQTTDGSWLNSRHITVFYKNETSNAICCRDLNRDEYFILKPEHGAVTQDLLDKLVKVICALRLTEFALSQHLLWKEINRS